ncbi:uncharacterized protein FIBRA_00466 [Fibroporia radiculosa]|uniref:FZ domain-containing protein n=1 Tax=Fibroporia radiculosa TaxID=599839 RepID=J4G099_9APHY|nr:uncharacterized protein FIBRA_00466 [Fibroporia radiculosa]CCL98468.1 predicted protein [Fibroporia radiculosa]
MDQDDATDGRVPTQLPAMRIRQTLFCLLQAWLTLAESQQLSLNQLYNFSTTPTSTTYSLPVSSSPLSVSVALCSSTTSNPPRFFVSNESGITPGPNNLGQANIYEIVLDADSLGSWTGSMSVSGMLAVYSSNQFPFEVGVSNNGPIHKVLDTLPLLGDSTANQVLLFSPPFSPPTFSVSTYPNYTFPPANLTFPTEPSSPPQFSIFIAPTSQALTSLPRTGCAMRASGGNIGLYEPSSSSEGLWLRDSDGWRWQWFVNGLTPQTNYTVYAVDNGTQVAGPIYFTTKSAAFACPILYSLPFCPSVSYAVPINSSNTAAGITAGELPEAVTENFLSGLTNFTVMLSTWACGRDLYSPIMTCTDCQAAYRTWLCLVSFPRCAEPPSSTTSFVSSKPTAQQVFPALQLQNASNPRNPNLPSFTQDYNAVLPCLEMCGAADRACPYFLGIKCPLAKYTASWSYGVGYIDSGEEGVMGGGSTGMAADRYGNVWCNAAGVL